MRVSKSVWDMEVLAAAVRGASDSLAEWQIVNEITGAVLSIDPDGDGQVTLTLWESQCPTE